ncbi:hypothetical protein EV646_10487 [Kribbella antiqua]|uniref:Uncharacterized protein n=1 Tax=Kribbella antiqua TaxID=2512217 RepID=A0A4V2S4H3_9ACTN|nr:hypothetical protein [Kribbella antiqua]TCO48270.1 hypothetical protein EV646_10487 [Kribbella antiqua]
MDWSAGRNGRVLAGVYLAGFTASLIGLVWTLVNQLTGGGGSQEVVGGVLFVGGQLVIYGLVRGLMQPGGRRDAGRLWNRLVLGRELVGAWRALRN